MKIANFAVGPDGFATAHRPSPIMRFKPTREYTKGQYYFYGCRRALKILSSGECRKIRNCSIFRENYCEVFL